MLMGLVVFGLIASGWAVEDFDQSEKCKETQTVGRTLPAWSVRVDLFFVISGFIMVYTAGKLFGQPGAAVQFLSRRLLRIVPLYWALTAALIAG